MREKEVSSLGDDEKELIELIQSVGFNAKEARIILSLWINEEMTTKELKTFATLHDSAISLYINRLLKIKVVAYDVRRNHQNQMVKQYRLSHDLKTILTDQVKRKSETVKQEFDAAKQKAATSKKESKKW